MCEHNKGHMILQHVHCLVSMCASMMDSDATYTIKEIQSLDTFKSRI